MQALVEILPWLTAMAALIGCSAFFSASEAALFYLRGQDRRMLASGGPSQRAAANLLRDPDRLLSAVLFWNLTVNITYFAIASIAGIHLEKKLAAGQSTAALFAIGSLLTIIFFSEMLPKSLAVINARILAGLIGAPLSAAVRLVDPLIPALRLANLLSRRLIWPSFKPEPSLEVSDLERAIALSTTDAQLIEQEQEALHNIVLLSEIRVDEWMRPRTQFVSFRPPVSLHDLAGKMTPSGYLLIREPNSEEIVSAIHLKDLSSAPEKHLEHHAQGVIYLPWCATAADALQQMQTRDREVVVVVNEFGESIGILTFEDLLDSVFTHNPTRSQRLLDRKAIHTIKPGVWHVVGLTSLRRLSRLLNIDLPQAKSVTITGILQESLQRLPQNGDECDWGPFHFRVLEAPDRGQMLVELVLLGQEEQNA